MPTEISEKIAELNAMKTAYVEKFVKLASQDPQHIKASHFQIPDDELIEAARKTGLAVKRW